MKPRERLVPIEDIRAGIGFRRVRPLLLRSRVSAVHEGAGNESGDQVRPLKFDGVESTLHQIASAQGYRRSAFPVLPV